MEEKELYISLGNEEVVYNLVKAYLHYFKQHIKLTERMRSNPPSNYHEIEYFAVDYCLIWTSMDKVYDLIEMEGYHVIVDENYDALVIDSEDKFYVLDDEAHAIKLKGD